MKPLLAAVLLLCLPGGASLAGAGNPAGPTMSVIDVPLHGERVLAASRAPKRFDLVGLHWQGTGTVRFRTHRLDGSWSAWRAAAPEADDLPDPGTAEARSSGTWHLGSPWWVGGSDRIEYRLSGSVTRLRAFLVASPVEAGASTPRRTLASAAEPAIVTRSEWNADESIRRAAPQYADHLAFAVVHHTAGTNTYTKAEAPAVVRGIELYHVQANGWNDIGYNFLVDRFGTIYEGRYGGIDRDVVGAHALGFNRGSVGIAVLGTYTAAAPPRVALDALARLLAWRLDLAHVDPLSSVQVVSGGSERIPAGRTVTLRAVSGHRDTGSTACPGDALYSRLDTLAAQAQAIGLPKIYAPLVSGTLGGDIRVQATLSDPRPWTISVTDQSGVQVATANGVGPQVDWTWGSAGVTAGSYTWQIAADGATPATGSLGTTTGVPVGLALTGVGVDPAAISPNGDGVADTATLGYTTTAAAVVTVTAVDANGQDVQVVSPSAEQAPGAHTLSFTGDGLPDGQYTLRVDASGAETNVTQSVAVSVLRTLGGVSVAPAAFSPNGDGRADRLTVRFTLAAAATVKVRVLAGRTWVATPFTGELAAGPRTVRWDGSKRLGRLLDGSYEAVVEATDAAGTSTLSVPFVSDTRAPTVRIEPGKPLRVWVSEPALLTVRVAGRSLRVTAARAGMQRIPVTGAPGRVRVVAWDTAGNASRPVLRG